MTRPPLESSSSPIDPKPVDVTVDEGLLRNLLKRSGRLLVRPALEALEMVLEPATPHQARVTVLAALTYLVVPIDLIPDLLPVAGFSDDLVALTALLGLCRNHITPEIKQRAQRRLDRWFPLLNP
ncbi:YkvA family protein [Synechococcus sp. W2B2]|uniref:YkvA family protein n=1 Tax=unclassified Synechococcus TaxID=2626047 RepID=UPI0005701EA4|nr:DUF1232 domain-containing protein [Synechococcus sp. WH 7805]